MAAKPMEGIQGAEHRDGAAPVSENGDPPPPAPRRHRERKWIYATVVLCCYGFFKEFKPSEPFLTPYLTDSNLTHGGKNFSTDDINELVYPIWTYSYGVSVFCALLLTDVLRYKPVILIECVSYLATRLLLIWGTSILDMQLMQVVYGVATATEIAYYSYIYVAVSITHFKQVTSYLRAMVLFGRSMSGLVGQLLVSLSLLNYLQLNYISFASVCVACVCAMFLPNICFSSSNNSTACKLLCCVTDPSASNPISPSSPSSPTSPTSPFSSPSPPSPSSSSPSPSIISKISTRVLAVLTERWKDFKTFYLTASLLRWSVWWAFATAGVLQVGNYVQSLWKEIGAETDTSYVYNGVVEAVTTLVAALAAFSLSLLRVNWSLWGEVSIGLLSLVQSLTLVFASQTKVLWLAYLCHVIYRTTYTFLITIASYVLSHLYIHKYIHTYILTYIHTYIHTYLLTYKAMAYTILNNAEGWGRANSAIQELLSAIVHF